MKSFLVFSGLLISFQTLASATATWTYSTCSMQAKEDGELKVLEGRGGSIHVAIEVHGMGTDTTQFAQVSLAPEDLSRLYWTDGKPTPSVKGDLTKLWKGDGHLEGVQAGDKPRILQMFYQQTGEYKGDAPYYIWQREFLTDSHGLDVQIATVETETDGIPETALSFSTVKIYSNTDVLDLGIWKMKDGTWNAKIFSSCGRAFGRPLKTLEDGQSKPIDEYVAGLLADYIPGIRPVSKRKLLEEN